MNPDGTQDKNAISLYERDSGTPDNPKVFHFDTIDASAPGFTAGLKTTSGFHDAVIYIKRLVQGSENAWDANNGCRNVKVFVEELVLLNGKYAFTAKGGCHDLLFSVTRMAGDVRIAHTNLGDWSDQNKSVTTGIKLDYPAPTTYRQLNATAPTGSNLRSILTIPGGAIGRAIFMFIFDILKRLNWA